MCGGDDHLAWKHPVFLEACRGLRTVGGGFTVTDLDSPLWIRVGGRLTRVSDQSDQRLDQRDIDSQVVTVDQFAVAMASIQEAIANLGQRIWTADPAGPSSGDQIEVAQPPITSPIPASEDPHARMDKLEQKLRQMRTSEGAITWEDFDGAQWPVYRPNSGCLRLRDHRHRMPSHPFETL
ncbi:hypothetical protein CK203_052427 [Vitis vinifera]|uniref:Uncharacterized protein n=1 Tax=Vitis vinifera TaxID=29760 RepID=A0A438H6C2_VITVI|nr:hypothetical protein CK203_052427 [Vitis vinifera]